MFCFGDTFYTYLTPPPLELAEVLNGWSQRLLFHQKTLNNKVILLVKNSVLHDFGFGKVSPAKQL